MKNTINIFLVMAIAFTGLSIVAQIPNASFEEWNTVSGIQEPDGWQTMNFLSVPNGFTSCIKSSAHYPEETGNYSIQIQNNTALSQMEGGWGIISTGGFYFPFIPIFPVTENPTGLTGYYNYDALNGDSALFMVQLFYNGVQVANGSNLLEGTDGWMPFIIDIEDEYVQADSGYITLAAFNPDMGTVGPKGNSVLLVDNLEWTTGVTVIHESAFAESFTLYPNPVTNELWINMRNPIANNAILHIYDASGKLVYSDNQLQNGVPVSTEHFLSGLYMIEVIQGNNTEIQKLVISH